MHDYDVALKRILTRPGSTLLTRLTGFPTLTWLNVETPLVRNLRVDQLGQSADGNLFHIETQSRNDNTLAMRMGEYSFGVGLRYGRLPFQAALYVGSEPMRMKNEIEGPGGTFRFNLIDVRDLDGEALLASDNVGDNIIAILTGLGREPGAVKRVLKRIAAAQPEERETALAELLIVSGLRKLDNEVRREAKLVPVQEDIMEHSVIGPAIRQGLAQGRIEGRVEGRIEGQTLLLLRQIQKRFGEVPPEIAKRLAALKPAQLERAGLRLLDARRIEDLFRR